VTINGDKISDILSENIDSTENLVSLNNQIKKLLFIYGFKFLNLFPFHNYVKFYKT